MDRRSLIKNAGIAGVLAAGVAPDGAHRWWHTPARTGSVVVTVLVPYAKPNADAAAQLAADRGTGARAPTPWMATRPVANSPNAGTTAVAPLASRLIAGDW